MHEQRRIKPVQPFPLSDYIARVNADTGAAMTATNATPTSIQDLRNACRVTRRLLEHRDGKAAHPGHENVRRARRVWAKWTLADLYALDARHGRADGSAGSLAQWAISCWHVWH
jgi:hypothetical protein